MEPSELYRHPEEGELVILVVRSERILMDDYRVDSFTTGLDEVRQQTVNLRRQSRLFFFQFFV